MAATVSSTLNLSLTTTETLDATLTPDAVTPQVVHNGLNLQKRLNATSTPAASATASKTGALTAGAATIDMTSLQGTNGVTVNATGLHVRAFLLSCPATNAAPVTFRFGASNPYNLRGSSWSITLQPGDAEEGYCSAAPAVGSGAKQIDVVGTGTDSFSYQFLLG